MIERKEEIKMYPLSKLFPSKMAYRKLMAQTFDYVIAIITPYNVLVNINNTINDKSHYV